ncbi:hypothetical protein ACJJI3_05115 [Microbulbifer sp. ZKSA004]|uniref:hypothetical protein n=1 Tax=Microbulbifer sp. ZKSA004 TaxID=3243389 RepID=UPI004039ACC5
MNTVGCRPDLGAVGKSSESGLASNAPSNLGGGSSILAGFTLFKLSGIGGLVTVTASVGAVSSSDTTLGSSAFGGDVEGRGVNGASNLTSSDVLVPGVGPGAIDTGTTISAIWVPIAISTETAKRQFWVVLMLESEVVVVLKSIYFVDHISIDLAKILFRKTL